MLKWYGDCHDPHFITVWGTFRDIYLSLNFQYLRQPRKEHWCDLYTNSFFKNSENFVRHPYINQVIRPNSKSCCIVWFVKFWQLFSLSINHLLMDSFEICLSNTGAEKLKLWCPWACWKNFLDDSTSDFPCFYISLRLYKPLLSFVKCL